MTTNSQYTVFSPVSLTELSKRKEIFDPAGVQLERHFAVLAAERALLAKMFTENEMALMLDACNGTWFDVYSIPAFREEIAEAIFMDHLDTKWEIDGSKLLAKLSGLSLGNLTAIVDAIECWWKQVREGKHPKPSDLFALS